MQQTANLYDFRVTWEPYLLRPGIPEGGVEKPPQFKNISKTGNLYKAGESVGIDFTGKCPKFPNTVLGHTMLEYAKTLDPTMKVQNQVVERIFQAYFTDGDYPNRALLDRVATELQLDMIPYNNYMDSKANVSKAEQSCLDWNTKVQTGVPFFIINGQPQFSGAQDSNVFIKVFTLVAARGNL